MATKLQITTTDDSNFAFFAQSVLDDIDTISRLGTKFKVTNTTGQSLTLIGTGFTYAPDGTPTGGTATSILFKDGNDIVTKVTGFSLSLPQLADALVNQGPAAAIALFGDVTFIGNVGNDVLLGTPGGDDRFDGGDGADTLIGGSGGRDVATYLSADAAVTASLVKPSINRGDAQGDTYDSIEDLVGSDFNDRLTGKSGGNDISGGFGNDRIEGRAGADTLEGGGGTDTLTGGKGADHLDGGGDADTFVYNFINEFGDTIAVVSATDTFRFRAAALGLTAGDPAPLVKGAAPVAPDADATFLFNTTTSQLLWDADGFGAGDAVVVFTISGAGTVNADSIDLV